MASPIPIDVSDGCRPCSACGKRLPLGEFAIRRSRKCGTAEICKNCRKPVTRDRKLKYRYGISAQQFRAMFDLQNGVCYLCNQPETARNRQLNVDHSHESGANRALLCFSCNSGLGKFRDSPELLRRAADYIEFFRSAPGRAGFTGSRGRIG